MQPDGSRNSAAAASFSARNCRPSSAVNMALERVLIVMAMEGEAQPLVEHYGLTKVVSPPWPASLPLVAYTGQVHGMQLHLVTNGKDATHGVDLVATTPACVNAYASIVAFDPQLVISAGTAGGFASRGAEIGDVFLSSKCIFHARRIPFGPAYEAYGLGSYEGPRLANLAQQAGCKTGVVSTGDSFDIVPSDLEIMNREGAAIKEMEAAAVAQVCQQLNVMYFALKSVTDIVDGDKATGDEFATNFAAAAAALKEKMIAILELAAPIPLSEWQAQE